MLMSRHEPEIKYVILKIVVNTNVTYCILLRKLPTYFINLIKLFYIFLILLFFRSKNVSTFDEASPRRSRSSACLTSSTWKQRPTIATTEAFSSKKCSKDCPKPKQIIDTTERFCSKDCSKTKTNNRYK